MRVIVAGVLEFPPETMHESLLAARAHIEGAYTEQGCVHYAWTEDPLNPGRVYVFEEWDTIEDLDTHLNDHWYTDMGAHLAASGLIKADVHEFRVDRKEPVYDETGVARAQFSGD